MWALIHFEGGGFALCANTAAVRPRAKQPLPRKIETWGRDRWRKPDPGSVSSRQSNVGFHSGFRRRRHGEAHLLGEVLVFERNSAKVIHGLAFAPDGMTAVAAGDGSETGGLGRGLTARSGPLSGSPIQHPNPCSALDNGGEVQEGRRRHITPRAEGSRPCRRSTST